MRTNENISDSSKVEHLKIKIPSSLYFLILNSKNPEQSINDRLMELIELGLKNKLKSTKA